VGDNLAGDLHFSRKLSMVTNAPATEILQVGHVVHHRIRAASEPLQNCKMSQPTNSSGLMDKP
jgi:hypothetical protein